jgi:hypothetical protein
MSFQERGNNGGVTPRDFVGISIRYEKAPELSDGAEKIIKTFNGHRISLGNQYDGALSIFFLKDHNIEKARKLSYIVDQALNENGTGVVVNELVNMGGDNDDFINTFIKHLDKNDRKLDGNNFAVILTSLSQPKIDKYIRNFNRENDGPTGQRDF